MGVWQAQSPDFGAHTQHLHCQPLKMKAQESCVQKAEGSSGRQQVSPVTLCKSQVSVIFDALLMRTALVVWSAEQGSEALPLRALWQPQPNSQTFQLAATHPQLANAKRSQSSVGFCFNFSAWTPWHPTPPDGLIPLGLSSAPHRSPARSPPKRS